MERTAKLINSDGVEFEKIRLLQRKNPPQVVICGLVGSKMRVFVRGNGDSYHEQSFAWVTEKGQVV